MCLKKKKKPSIAKICVHAVIQLWLKQTTHEGHRHPILHRPLLTACGSLGVFCPSRAQRLPAVCSFYLRIWAEPRAIAAARPSPKRDRYHSGARVIHQPLVTRTGPDIKPGSCAGAARNLRRQPLWALMPSQGAPCSAPSGPAKVSLSTLIVLLYNRSPFFSQKHGPALVYCAKIGKVEGPYTQVLFSCAVRSFRGKKKPRCSFSKNYSYSFIMHSMAIMGLYTNQT